MNTRRLSLLRCLPFALLALAAACASEFRPDGQPRPGDATSAASKAAESAASSKAPEAPAPIEISIVGTNDVHGRVASLPILGGYMSALRAARRGRVVLVDAGDMFQGTLESNPNEGAAVVEAYRALRYDAVAIGNHEFDYGPVGEDAIVRKKNPSGGSAAAASPPGSDDPRGALKARAAQAAGAFPFLAANILEDGKPVAWPNVKPSALVTLESGVTVGVIGVTTVSTPKTTIRANVEGISIAPLAESITREAGTLRAQGANIIVVAAHAGGECKKLDAPDDLSSCVDRSEIFEVARALPQGSVDVIVAGHTHKGIAHRVAGIPIIESISNGAMFGRVDVTWDPAAKRVVSAKIHEPTRIEAGVLYEGRKVEPSPEVARTVAPAIEKAAARRAAPLGAALAAAFETKYREESSLGNLLTTLMLDLEPRADAALTNGGGLRVDLPAGPLTYGSLYDTLPFENRLARVTMTGAALAELFRKNLASARGIFSVAGVRVVARCAASGLIVKLEKEGRKGGKAKPIADNDRLLLVTSDFLATGGDDFAGPESVSIDEGAPPYRDDLAEIFKKRGGTLAPSDWLKPTAPRIRVEGATRDGEGRLLCPSAAAKSAEP